MKHFKLRWLVYCMLFCYTFLQAQEQPFCGEVNHQDQPLSDIHKNFTFETDEQGNTIKKPDYRWLDRFGNRYADLEIRKDIDQSRNVPEFGYTNPDCQSQGGLFNIYVEDIQENTGVGFDLPANNDMLNVICQVFSDLDVLIDQQASTCAGNQKSPVNIRVRSFDDSSSGVLGSASSFYDFQGEHNGIKHGEVWKAINTGHNNDNVWDGQININLGYTNWYTGFGNTPAGQIDLYTVMLHEILHSLGFASLIDQNGQSKFQGSGLDSYSNYDTFLTSDNGTALLINTAGYNWDFNNAVPVSVLTSGCNVPGPNPEFRGDFNAPLSPIHAPANWSGGSSISHFETNCDSYGNTADYVMNPGIAPGTLRRLTQEEINTLADIGYQLNGTYGTATLQNGNPNPRQHNNFTAPNITSLVATDDYGPCCNGTYTIEACAGNSLNISINDLLCNDITSGATVTLVEDLASNVILPIGGGNISYTPSATGTQVLRYILEDGNGNQSNYAYIYVDVFPCAGFNCVNTDNCNLVCNPILEDGGSCDDSTSCKRQIDDDPDNTVNCQDGFSSIDGWYPIVGTPDSVEENCSSIGLNSLPAVSGDEYLFFWDGQGFEEGMMTATQVDPSKRYILSYHRAEGLGNNFNHQMDVFLTNLDQVTWFPNPGPNASGASIPANQQTIISDQFTSSDWEQTIQCFSPNQAYDILYFRSFSFGNTLSGVYLDQIELVEDRILDIETDFLVGCLETLVIGESLCTITNMEYSWWDVTDSNTPIQLTQGSDVISGNVSIPNGGNGSELEINPTENTIYELRRNFVSSNGIAIANNNCDAAVQVNVTVDLDITLTKKVVGSEEVPNGAPVTYQITVENNTGNDITNLDITDVLATNFDISTLNVSANSNVTNSNAGNTITFTVLNLPNGSSETIEFSVVVTGQEGEIIENCANLEYLECPIESCIPIIINACEIRIENIDFEVTNCELHYSASIEGSDAISWEWDFGDNETASDGPNGVHVYDELETYEVCLTVFCDSETSDTYCFTITIDDSCDPSCCDEANNLAHNGNFNDATCGGGTPNYEDCMPHWNVEDGTPSIPGFPANPYTWMWSYSGNGEAISTDVKFIKGVTYSLCFRVRTDDKNTGDPNVANNATVNLIATNNAGNVTGNPNGQIIFKEAMGPYLNTWTNVEVKFKADDNYSTLWVFPFMSQGSTNHSQSEMSIDDIIVSQCCDEEITIEPAWDHPECPVDICEAGKWPIHAVDSMGNPIYTAGGCVSITWENLTTGEIHHGDFGIAYTGHEIKVTIEYEDSGCTYETTYFEDCCNDEFEIVPYDCDMPLAQKEKILSDMLEQYTSSLESKNSKMSAALLRAIRYLESSDKECDPCITGEVFVFLYQVENGIYTLLDLNLYDVTWSDNGCCNTRVLDVNTPYTVTIKNKEDDCEYTLDFIYECEDDCSVATPTNVQVIDNIISWDPVPGAIGYIVENATIWPIDCRCEFPSSIAQPIETTGTSVTLPTGHGRCFAVQVRAICADGSPSQPSEVICVGGRRGDPKQIEKIEISPNPNKGDMHIKIFGEKGAEFQLNVYSFNGTLIKTFENKRMQDSSISMYWDAKSKLTKGIYFFIFSTDKERITKQVIIQ